MAFGFDQTNIFAEMPLALISGDVFGIGGAWSCSVYLYPKFPPIYIPYAHEIMTTAIKFCWLFATQAETQK